MVDLQAVEQQLGVNGRGKHWIVITSQKQLNELVSGLEGLKIELARRCDQKTAGPLARRRRRDRYVSERGSARPRASVAPTAPNSGKCWLQ
jgi:hypothetical protein